jgi:HSP20 family protein
MTKQPERKKTERPFDDVPEMDRFFDEYMTRIEEQMADFFDDAMEAKGQAKGFVFGFHMTTGSNGKPVIEEFGNDNNEADEGTEMKSGPAIKNTPLSENEPLTDVIDEEKVVRVLAELPGVAREDIKICVKPGEVTINVDTATRKYRKEIALPCKVSTENVKTTHKNGILEIIISKPI